MTADQGFNPLDKMSLGLTVAKAMLERPVEQLPPQTPFPGAGIYAIYYSGVKYPPYVLVSERNRDSRFEYPIYVGKAVPAGARKGVRPPKIPRRVPASEIVKAGPLYKRLCEHAESIQQSRNLNIGDFFCRHLVVDDIWIPLGESLLVQQFEPIWNVVIDGFGNHDPGGGRKNQQRSSWDVLHPGRPWAERLRKNVKSEQVILENLARFFSGRPAEMVADPLAGDQSGEEDE